MQKSSVGGSRILTPSYRVSMFFCLNVGILIFIQGLRGLHNYFNHVGVWGGTLYSVAIGIYA